MSGKKQQGAPKIQSPLLGYSIIPAAGRVNILPVFTMSWYSDNNYNLTT
jgi:hypothetical protein